MKKSRISVKIKGLNQERALNTISKKIAIYNLKKQSPSLSSFEIDFKNKKKLLPILQENNLEIQNISAQGIKWKIQNFFSSFGIIAALLICTFLYIFQYNFILQIKVVGEVRLKEKEIVKFVKTKLSSSFKSKINVEKIEKSIISNYNEISSVSVAIVGQTLFININEKVLPDEMVGGKEALVSTYDGIITDINIIQGTLAVDVGDVVKKGDVLVYPYIIDSQGEKRDVVPKAEIKADVWIMTSETFYDYKIETTRTGRKEIISNVYLNNLLIYSSNHNCSFEDYETEENEKFISKNNILPFKVKKTTYYEVFTKEVYQDFSQVKEEIIEKARQKALIFLQENEIIKEEKSSIKEAGGIHQVDYLITVNRNIGE